MGPTRLLRVALDSDLAPERAALLVRDDPHPFALIGEWGNGRAVVGSEPVRVARPDEDPFALLDEQPRVQGELEPGAIGGGWFGRLGFGLAARLERLHPAPPRPVPLPDFNLAFYDHLLRADATGRWWFEALLTPAREAALHARREVLEARLRAAPQARSVSTSPWRATPGLDGHRVAVAACRERIHAGDLFQASLTLRLEAGLIGDAVDLFTRGISVLRPPRAAFLAGPWGAVASLSPELFLERRGREVLTAPIKGTRPLGERAALVASAKDRAENVMIVDLMRNDLGKVCTPGSVRVPTLCEPREHTGVWHLVSEVAGTLPEGTGDAALLRASFPPGSVTGAPKPAALDVISELESTGRETYTGAIGFASPVAGLELSVAIRTFEHRDGRIWLGIGGGVVADSVPAAEAAECLTKAGPLLKAIGAEPAIGGGGTPPGSPGRRGPRPVPRPDAALGVFTTVLARDGVAVAGDLHLARLGRSVEELFGLPLPPGAQERLDEVAARSLEPARVRLSIRPGDSGRLVLDVDRSALPAPVPVRLRSVVLPGGLGVHKWLDRRMLNSLAAAAAAPGELALLVDLDGLVLEASRASVFIVEGAALATPPLDGRILPGVTRSRLIGVAGSDVREEPVSLERLRSADGILLTGALRGVETVSVCDGSRSPELCRTAADLNHRLDRFVPATATTT